jgi:hypothetical protein
MAQPIPLSVSFRLIFDLDTDLILDSVAIGTPPQPIELSLDTGSGITWVNPDCLTGNSDYEIDYCQSLDRYNPRSSSTSARIETGMHIEYGDNSQVTMQFYTDTFTVGTAKVQQQRFGVAQSTKQQQQGILGIGPLPGEIKNYSTLIDSLAAQKQIATNAFSLDLRAADKDTGSLIFGGVDTKKYACELSVLDMIHSFDDVPRYLVHLTNVSQTKPGEAKAIDYPQSIFFTRRDKEGLPVDLDSGGTVTILPPALVKAIGTDYPDATYDPPTGLYNVSCTAPPGTINFGFAGGKTIKVSYQDFLWVRPKTTQCVLGMIEGSEPIMYLGDSFLRAAYVVIDQENGKIWLDQVDDCGSEIVGIKPGVDGLPKVKGCSCK